MKKICLVSTGQPSTNPRLVKEADALSEKGYKVTALCSYWSEWGYKFDKEILKNAKWKCIYIGGTPYSEKFKYNYTRIRFKSARKFYKKFNFLQTYALSRTAPELINAAKKIKADLYIGHNLGALPAVVEAATYNNSKSGFDTEDFYSGMSSQNGNLSIDDQLAEHFENNYLKKCDYITGASKKISEEYAIKYGIDEPETILNVFPLSLRPLKFREHQKDQPLKLFWFSQTLGNGRGIEDVVKALGLLNKQDIELHLLGSCSNEYKNSLLRFFQSVDSNSKNIFFYEPILADEIVKFSSNFDIGLSLEQPETLNRNICLTNKTFSYFLAGNAIIATNTQGQADIASAASNAIKSYKPNDIESLVAIIENWHKNRNDLEEARKSSWEYGTSIYNWDLEKNKFLSLVGKVLS